MIRTIKVLFCDNEHGNGDVTFPDLRHVEPTDIVNGGSATTKHLRAETAKSGWRHYRGSDYCEMCAEDCAPTTRRKSKPKSGNLFEENQ